MDEIEKTNKPLKKFLNETGLYPPGMDVPPTANDCRKGQYKHAFYRYWLKTNKLKQQNAILREALEFYADKDNWTIPLVQIGFPMPKLVPPVERERFDIARIALDKVKQKEK